MSVTKLVEKFARDVEGVDPGKTPKQVLHSIVLPFLPRAPCPGTFFEGPRAAPSAAVDSSFRGSGGGRLVPGAARGRMGCLPALGTPGARALHSGRPGGGKTRPPDQPCLPRPPKPGRTAGSL